MHVQSHGLRRNLFRCRRGTKASLCDELLHSSYSAHDPLFRDQPQPSETTIYSDAIANTENNIAQKCPSNQPTAPSTAQLPRPSFSASSGARTAPSSPTSSASRLPSTPPTSRTTLPYYQPTSANNQSKYTPGPPAPSQNSQAYSQASYPPDYYRVQQSGRGWSIS